MSNPDRVNDEGIGPTTSTHTHTTSGVAHREIDIEAGGGGEAAPAEPVNDTSSPRSWRIDFDLNFDPSWLPTGTGVRQLQRPLSMLNDWVRNSIPSNTPASVSTIHPSILQNISSAGGAPPNNNSSSNSVNQSRRGSLSSSNGTTNEPAQFHSQSLPGGRPHGRIARASSHQSRSTAAEDEPEDVASAGDSQTYVVDMESNTNWANSPDESRVVPGGAREPITPPESPTSENATSEILRLRQSPEARAFINIIERYTPFALILFIKGIFDHGSGILCFMALLITFGHANSLFKKEVAKQSKRNIFYLAMIVVNLLICIVFMYYVFEDQKLYPALVFMNTSMELTNIWTLLWVVGVTDYVAKFLTIIVKSLFLALPERITPFQKRGKYYLFVEQTSQVYRSLLPLHPWFFFLFESYDGSLQVFGFILTGLYILFKIGDILQRFKAWRIAFGKLLQQVHYGSCPTAEEMSNVGSQCPICHDSFNHPTRLSCTHIFCEECVSTWFDRERTCPMCRAKVVDDPAFRDGSTTHFIQLF